MNISTHTCLHPSTTGIIHSGSVAWVLSSISVYLKVMLARRGSPAPTHVQQITSACCSNSFSACRIRALNLFLLWPWLCYVETPNWPQLLFFVVGGWWDTGTRSCPGRCTQRGWRTDPVDLLKDSWWIIITVIMKNSRSNTRPQSGSVDLLKFSWWIITTVII